MQVFDASSMIHAWDNYPEPQFPPMWEWMKTRIEEKELVMPSVAFEEVAHLTPDCGEWLKYNNIEQFQISNSILEYSLYIKGLLGIVGDHYNPAGVGENDIFIIATTFIHRGELVSNEGRQQNIPVNLTRCKIPAVCAMAEVSVPCINFIEFIKRSGEIFR